jgi:hypothetical protein
MSESKMSGGRGIVLWSMLATASVAAACGDSFGSEDCKVTRTCAPIGGTGASAGEDGGDSKAGDATGGTTSAGAGGEAGAAVVAECVIAADCTNDDPADGTEACESGVCVAGNPPPRVVSVTPSAEGDAAEPNAEIVIEFSEPLDEATVDAESVRIASGDEAVAGTLSYAGLKATFVPDVPLRLRGEYSVTVSTDVTDEVGAALLEEFSSELKVRDGAWRAIDALTGDFNQLAPTMPMTSSGAVLLVWSGGSAKNCPTSAGWFELGASTTQPTAFLDSAGASCVAARSAANLAGTAVVTWTQDAPSYAQQLRDGNWLAKSAQLYGNAQTYPTALSVGADGRISRFDVKDTGGLSVVQTDADGVWAAKPDVLTTQAAWSAPSVAFDDAGNGLAVWASTLVSTDRARIAWSRYTSETGKWSPAADIPDSVAGAVGERRGAPTVALAPSGEGVVVWRDSPVDGKINANHFLPDSGWSSAEVASGGTVVPYVFDAAPVVFDGKSFVVAWEAFGSGVTQQFTARLLAEGQWSAPEPHDSKKGLPYSQMPLLATDGHGTIVLVWKTGTTPNYALYHRRFESGAWGAIQALPGGTITDPANQGAQKPALAMNASGVVAISWANRNENERIGAVRLARFD